MGYAALSWWVAGRREIQTFAPPCMCKALSLSPDLFCLFEPRAEGRRGDALPVAADERKETLGINSIEKIWQKDHDHDRWMGVTPFAST